MSYDVFISHSSDNKLIADKLANDLRTRRLTVWIDTENLKYGFPWREAIEEALKDSKAIVLMLDEKNKKNSYEQDEWSMVLEATWADPNKRIIPLLLGNAKIPSFLYDYQAIKIGNKKEEWDHVISEIINVLQSGLKIDNGGRNLATTNGDGTARAWNEPRVRRLNRIQDLENSVDLLRQSEDSLVKSRRILEQDLEDKLRIMSSDDPSLSNMLLKLGHIAKEQGDFSTARKYLERALENNMRVLGPDNPSVATTWSNLGLIAKEQGDFDAASRYLKRALENNMRVLGPDHPSVATIWSNLGLIAKEQGDFSTACKYLERALENNMRVLGPDNPSVATIWSNLGLIAKEQSDFSTARKYFERALETNIRVLGPDHHLVITIKSNLSSIIKELNREDN